MFKERFNRIRTIRKRWFAVAGAMVALLAVGLVIGGGLAAGRSMAMADGGSFGYGYGGYGFGYGQDERRGGHRGGDADGSREALLSRVAEIVGVEAGELRAAFVTAQEEQVTAKFGERAGELVVDGTLTQEQGAAVAGWFGTRPAGSGKLAYYAAGSADTEQVSERLSRMTDAGYLTQEESDALAAWHGQRPDGLPEFGKMRGWHDGGRKFGGGRGHHRDGDGDSDGNGDGG